jgi:hypothetical protein
MADVQESYPLPTSGIGAPLKIALSGSGVSQIKGSVYQVSLSLGGTATVSVTATAQDAAGTTASPAYTGAFNWVSRNAEPHAAQSGDVVESYPASTSGKFGRVAHVSAATGNPITVTGDFVGRAIVEVFIPFGDADGTNNYLDSGAVYAQLVVTVGV